MEYSLDPASFEGMDCVLSFFYRKIYGVLERKIGFRKNSFYRGYFSAFIQPFDLDLV